MNNKMAMRWNGHLMRLPLTFVGIVATVAFAGIASASHLVDSPLACDAHVEAGASAACTLSDPVALPLFCIVQGGGLGPGSGFVYAYVSNGGLCLLPLAGDGTSAGAGATLP